MMTLPSHFTPKQMAIKTMAQIIENAISQCVWNWPTWAMLSLAESKTL
jgi:hypothetical protein